MSAVLCEKKDQIATITLNRPEVLNTIDWDFIRYFSQILNDLEADANVRAVVLTGQGKGFCAGGDLPTILSFKTNEDTRTFIKAAGGLASKLFDFPKPVVGMINGVAAGAGFNIALACDILVASQKARFAQSFSAVGLHPDMGGTYLLPRVVGLAKAKELMFTADILTADDALRLGIVNRVVADEELNAQTYALAAKLAKAAPLALKMIKQGVNRSLECTWETLLQIETTNQVACWASQDGKEGISAFVEKRAPKFTGN